MKKILIAVSLSLIIAGCSSKSTVLDAGNGTHEILIVGDTGFTSLSKMQIKATKEAQYYCAKQGKKYVLINKRVQPQGFGVWPEVDILFRCR